MVPGVFQTSHTSALSTFGFRVVDLRFSAFGLERGGGGEWGLSATGKPAEICIKTKKPPRIMIQSNEIFKDIQTNIKR